MARPELRIMSSAPRATPLRICARFTWLSVPKGGARGRPGVRAAHGRVIASPERLLLAGRVRRGVRLGAGGGGHDLEREAIARLDHLADVAGPHELLVGI